MKILRGFVAAVLIASLLLGGCATATQDAAPTSSATASAGDAQSGAGEAQFSSLPQLEGEATVEMVIKGAPVRIELRGDVAPVTAGNFVDLVQRGVYDDLMFHRVVREPQPFVVQGGDPQSKDPDFPVNRLGTGGFVDPATNAPRYIPLEIEPEGTEQPLYSQTFETAGITQPPKLRHTRGAVAMARSVLPDSASSQFYFALADLAFLDGSYAVFGYVTEGMEVIDQVQQGDRIESAKVISGSENLKTAN